MDYFGEFVALGIDSLIVAVCLKMYIKSRHAIQIIQDVKVHEIGPELEKYVESQPNHKLPYVAVRGTVKATGSPLRSLNSPNITGVVQKLSVKEHVVTRSTTGFWADQERTIQEIYNYVPFVLYTHKTQIEVVDPLAADILDLDTVADKFEPSKLGLVDHLWGFFTGVRQRGLQSTEDMLREGVNITGIGEAVFDGEGNACLKLQPPADGSPFYLTSMPVLSLVRRLDHQKRTYKFLTVIFGCVGVFILAFVTRRWWTDRLRRIQDERNRRSLEETRRERRRKMREQDIPDIHLCVVCRHNPREIIILPCGHVCLCEDCSDTIYDKCPVCRSNIEKKVPAYIS